MTLATVAERPALAPLGRPRSLAALVTDQIREMIVTGHIELGAQISENTIAEQLRVSRTPVRDAFAQLQAERLVEVRPQRGTFVFQYDARELREICELRAVLETGALRIAAAHDRPHLLATLAEALAAAAPAVAAGAADYQPHDTAFHERLVRASGNRELIEAYARISGRIRAVRYRLTRTPAQVADSQRHHADIVGAMQDGDDGRAAELLRRHVYNSYRFFLDHLEDAA